MNNKAKLQPVTASAYLKNTAEAVELPSGNIFLLRKISIQTYLKNGRLPESLLKKVMGKWEVIEKLTDTEKGQEVMKDASDREVEKMLIFQADVVNDACVSPKLVVDADGSNDDELNPNDLTQEDFNFIFNWVAQGGVKANPFAKFR